MKELFLVRAIPGSGKTTLANIIAPEANVAADEYFEFFNNGKFDASLLKEAHRFCQQHTKALMEEGREVIAVHNTFTRKAEMTFYFEVAKLYGYRVHSIVVENRHGGESIHGVPPETIAKMVERFEIQLK